jgi:hypothetical protein
VGLQDRLQAPLVAPPSQGRDAPPEATDPTGLDDGEDDKEDDGDGEGRGNRAEVVTDDGVEIDDGLLEGFGRF